MASKKKQNEVTLKIKYNALKDLKRGHFYFYEKKLYLTFCFVRIVLHKTNNLFLKYYASFFYSAVNPLTLPHQNAAGKSNSYKSKLM